MSGVNGVNGSANGCEITTLPVPIQVTTKPRMSQKRLKILDELAVPFDPAIIQWRIVETTKIVGKQRGRVLPYADKTAYIERLNWLLTPLGWSSNVSVHTAAVNPGERGRSAKVVVACSVTIHGLGTHSSTGEKWATDENAATSAEAQAFKRACTHFYLGNYLNYFFRGRWVDLDSEGRIINPPTLPEWATPAGWLNGARPSMERIPDDQSEASADAAVIREIESMRQELGAQVYRGVLKQYRVWEPKQIGSPEMAKSILADMKTVHELMIRASQALGQIGQTAFNEIIKRHNVRSIETFGNVESLRQIVEELEAKAAANDVPDSQESDCRDRTPKRDEL